MATVYETFTHVSRNALNIKVDPQMEASGSQWVVVFSLFTESISFLHFSLFFLLFFYHLSYSFMHFLALYLRPASDTYRYP